LPEGIHGLRAKRRKEIGKGSKSDWRQELARVRGELKAVVLAEPNRSSKERDTGTKEIALERICEQNLS
jgi:hypothetical protein